MNIEQILLNPDLIDTLDSNTKTQLYLSLIKTKTTLNNKINELKAKKEILEKQKEELTNELYNESNTTNMEELSKYIKEIETKFNEDFKKEVINLNSIKEKLN